jgi:hypothetical protein
MSDQELTPDQSAILEWIVRNARRGRGAIKIYHTTALPGSTEGSLWIETGDAERSPSRSASTVDMFRLRDLGYITEDSVSYGAFEGSLTPKVLDKFPTKTWGLVQAEGGTSAFANVDGPTPGELEPSADPESVPRDDMRSPDMNDIRKLPKWARVVYAAKNVRRLLPLLLSGLGTAKYHEAIADGLNLIENAAKTATTLSGFGRLGDLVGRLRALAEFQHKADPPSYSDAVEAFDSAVQAVVGPDDIRAASRTGIMSLLDPAMDAACRADYDRLLAFSKANGWTDTSSVHPDFAGPLWPEGEAVWVPASSGASRQDRLSPPTAADLKRLPRWARVAFAARCARRVQPNFLNWRDGDSRSRYGVQAAIDYAESVGAKSLVDQPHISDVEDAVSSAIGAAIYQSERAKAGEKAAARLAAQGGAAAKAAFLDALVNLHDETDSNRSAELTADAVAEASRVVDITRDIWRDFDLLFELAAAEKWTDDTPVPPSVFGPMWPDGEPEWAKPSDNAGPQESDSPSLEVYIDPGAASVETIQAVFDALSDLQAAAGGLGLDFTPDESGAIIAEEVHA